MNATESVLELLYQEPGQVITTAHKNQISRCIVDYAGCLWAGRAYACSTLEAIKAFLCEHSGDHTVKSRQELAFEYGFYSHVLELDDGHRLAMLHIGAPIISALLAILDEKCDWELFEFAIAVGYEVTVRLGECLQPAHKLKGFHATGTCGTMGATAACCALLQLDTKTAISALGCASTLAAGNLEVIGDGSMLKPVNVANAARNAVLSIAMAKSGLCGPTDPIGGKRGFLSIFCAGSKPVYDKALNSIFEIYIKPYGACRHCHPAIEASFRAFEALEAKPGEIVSVEVRTYDLAVFGHDMREVDTVAEAKMSTPVCIAHMLLDIGCGVGSITDESVAREDVRGLAKRVSVVPDEEMTAQAPSKRGAVATVRLRNGAVCSHRVDYPLGEPENPIGDSELDGKSMELLCFSGMDKQEARSLIKSVRERALTPFEMRQYVGEGGSR